MGRGGLCGPRRRHAGRAAKPQVGRMKELFGFMGPVVMGLVVLVLLAGIWNMFRGGSPNLSQLLMRWRVGLQFLAICILLVTVYLSS